MKRLLKILIPIAIVVCAIAVTVVMVIFKKKAETKPVEIKPTLVQVVPAETESQTFRVRTQGTVVPGRNRP